MLADFLPSSCFLHSGEIIRNDFILTAQMNTKWRFGLLLLQIEGARYGNLNSGSCKLQRNLSLKIIAGVHFQLASIENQGSCCLPAVLEYNIFHNPFIVPESSVYLGGP